MNEIKWQTIKSFPTVIEAQLAQSKLKSEGIECFLRDQYTIGINILYSNALGGVRLDVKEGDIERARAILAEVPPEEPIRCERCNSVDVIKKDASWRLAFFVFFILQIPLPFSRPKYQCQNCNHEFSLAKISSQ